MPGLSGEKGESGHVGLLVSLSGIPLRYHMVICYGLSKQMSFFLVSGSSWSNRPYWCSGTDWRTGKTQKLVLSLIPAVDPSRFLKESDFQGPSGRLGMIGQPGLVGEKVKTAVTPVKDDST